MYFTNGSSRAFEMLMRGKPGFDRYENGGCADCEDCKQNIDSILSPNRGQEQDRPCSFSDIRTLFPSNLMCVRRFRLTIAHYFSII